MSQAVTHTQIDATISRFGENHGRLPVLTGGYDSILVAHAWLDAQPKTSSHGYQCRWHALKHIIEAWAGVSVSVDAVQIAADMLGLQGKYPYYNLRGKLVEPDRARLAGIRSAGAMPDYAHGGYDAVYRTPHGRKHRAEVLL